MIGTPDVSAGSPARLGRAVLSISRIRPANGEADPRCELIRPVIYHGGDWDVLSSLNAERILVGSESVGDGRWFVDYAVKDGNERRVFDRPVGMNQGVQFPIAKAHVGVEAASLMRFKACALFDAGQPCGAEANMTKYLASEAAWEAGEAAMGGYGFAKEYHVERKWREARLYRIAPISNNLVLSDFGEHLLGRPRSY